MNATNLTAAEKNAHYGELNTRFDARADELRALGFKYEHVTGLNIAVFTKTRHARVHAIAAGTVMNAGTVVWADTLDSAGRFCA